MQTSRNTLGCHAFARIADVNRHTARNILGKGDPRTLRNATIRKCVHALGLTVMENILTAHPNIKGVFATNDQMALGAMEALEARGLRGKVKIVGFDATKEAVQATVEGRLAGSVAQNPFMMGQRGVEAALDALDGMPVVKRIDSGSELVTAANAAKYLK